MVIEDVVLLIQRGIDTKENLEKLYFELLPNIKKSAKPYSYYCDINDLLQESFFAVKRAAELWSPDGGASFISYLSFWLKSFMARYAGRNLSYLKHTESLDTVLYNDADGDPVRLEDIIKDKNDLIEDSTLRMEERELKEKIWQMVDNLSCQESEMLHDIFEHDMSLKECSDKHHLSPERCRQIKLSGLKKMRYKKQELTPYMIDSIESYAMHHSGRNEYKYTNTSCVEKAVIRLFDHKEV